MASATNGFRELPGYNTERWSSKEDRVNCFFISSHDPLEWLFSGLEFVLNSARRTSALFVLKVELVEALGSAMRYSVERFKGRKITGIFLAHGNENGMIFPDGIFDSERVDPKDFEGFDQVMFFACWSGNLAKKVAEVTQCRAVFGARKKVNIEYSILWRGRPVCLDEKGENAYFQCGSQEGETDTEILGAMQRAAEEGDEDARHCLIGYCERSEQPILGERLIGAASKPCGLYAYILGRWSAGNGDFKKAREHFLEAQRLGYSQGETAALKICAIEHYNKAYDYLPFLVLWDKAAECFFEYIRYKCLEIQTLRREIYRDEPFRSSLINLSKLVQLGVPQAEMFWRMLFQSSKLRPLMEKLGFSESEEGRLKKRRLCGVVPSEQEEKRLRSFLPR